MQVKMLDQDHTILNIISKRKLGRINKKFHLKMQIDSQNSSTVKELKSQGLGIMNLEIRWKINWSIRFKEDIEDSLDQLKLGLNSQNKRNIQAQENMTLGHINKKNNLILFSNPQQKEKEYKTIQMLLLQECIIPTNMTFLQGLLNNKKMIQIR